MKKTFEIYSDCLDIVKRIKAIDKDYFVMYNPDTSKFELHNKSQRNSYCLAFPFDTLDDRAVAWTLKTRVQNADEIFKQMEKENERIRQKAVTDVLNKVKERVYDS